MKKIVIIMVAIIVAIIIVFASIGFGYIYLQQDAAGKGRDEGKVVFKIEQGQSTQAIISNLKEEGIIKHDFWYKFYLSKTGEGANIQAGTFTLDKDLNYQEITGIITEAKQYRETVTVTFPEGSTAVQFANIIEKSGLCTAEEFLDVANNGDFSDLTFWNKISVDEPLFLKAEGYLAPNTYEFFKDDSVYNIVYKLYAQFDSLITDEMYARMDEIGFTLSETITLASLIEEEAGNPENQPGVSGVFTNRLQEDSPYPKMGSDVTWHYVTDFIQPYYGGEENTPDEIVNSYWTEDGYAESRVGLPVGPISCPGNNAINAALYPEEHDYYFFLTDLTGKYYYAETYDQHLNNVAEMKRVNATVE